LNASTTGSPTRAAWASTACLGDRDAQRLLAQHRLARIERGVGELGGSCGRCRCTRHPRRRARAPRRTCRRPTHRGGRRTHAPDAVSRTHRVQNSVFGVRQRRKEVARDDAGAQDRPACFVAHGSTLGAGPRAGVARMRMRMRSTEAEIARRMLRIRCRCPHPCTWRSADGRRRPSQGCREVLRPIRHNRPRRPNLCW
jgi:hypothetical protein